MKNLILILMLSVFSQLCFAQRMLNEVRLTNSLLEEISPSSIPDAKAYQKQKFKAPKGRLSQVDFKSHKNSKLYKLKNSDDLIEISPMLYKGLFENWDKTVPEYIGTLTPLSPGHERYTENVAGKDFKATIFFVKDYKLTNKNYILYNNMGANIVLFIKYISNSPDNEKIETMRKIVKGMKVN